MAQEVLAEPVLLSLVRLCGIREIIAFALGAFNLLSAIAGREWG
jgi:hypothetical protein